MNSIWLSRWNSIFLLPVENGSVHLQYCYYYFFFTPFDFSLLILFSYHIHNLAWNVTSLSLRYLHHITYITAHCVTLIDLDMIMLPYLNINFFNAYTNISPTAEEMHALQSIIALKTNTRIKIRSYLLLFSVFHTKCSWETYFKSRVFL